MAVPAALEALMLGHSRVGVLCAGVVLTKQRAITRVSRNQHVQVMKTDSDISLHLKIIKIDLCRLALTQLP